MKHGLLILGLVFPLISLLTLAAAFIQFRATGKGASGVYIPIIGPLLIGLWLLSIGAPKWTLVIPWVADIGTLVFLCVIPQMISEGWRYSRFTRTSLLVGERANQTVQITLHKGGHYAMKKQWHRPPNECGITGLGDPGTYEEEGNEVTLTSHSGRTRIIRKQNDEFLITDLGDKGDHSLDGWSLRNKKA